MTRKTRTITLTVPVQIVEDEWPIIARASGDSYDGGDVYHLFVRRHPDGRTIVYGVLRAAPWTGSVDRRGGRLLDPGANMVQAIRQVGEDCELPDRVIRECIALASQAQEPYSAEAPPVLDD